jgi:outer membrane protein
LKIIRFVPLISGLVLALAASAQSNGKVGVMNLQAAIAGTKDGQKASNDLQQRFGPRRTDLEKRQADVQQLQEKLAKATTDDERARLAREIDQKTKAINRDREDAQSELEQEEQKLVNILGGKVVALSEKYAKDHGYTWILDVSGQQTPVIYFSETIDITKDVIDLYDKAGTAASTGTAPPAAKPVVPAAKPAAPPK